MGVPVEPIANAAHVNVRPRRLLGVGEIWAAVRSGAWYPDGWEDPEVAAQLLVDADAADRVRDTATFIVERFDKSRTTEMEPLGAKAPKLSDIVELNKDILDYSIPELRCILAALQSLSSPWRKLPAELLIEIFSWCIQPNTAFSTSQAPLLLTKICSRWYNVSANTPCLWTSLVLTGNFLIREEADLHAATLFEKTWRGKPGLGPNTAAFMSLILHRSRALPFSLSSHSGILHAPDTRRLFYEHVSRSKGLALLFPESDDWYSPPPPVNLDPFVAPLLETLDIYALQVRSPPFISQGKNWSAPFMDLIQSCAPKLRRLNFVMYGAPAWPNFNSGHTWNKLTHITWRPTIPDTELIKLFHSAPNLVYASFPGILPRLGNYASNSSAEALRQQSPVVLKNLDTLVVGMLDMTTVFDAITTPNLRHLVHLAPSNEDKRAMIGFFRRSACRLETLYMYHASYHWYTDLLDVWESVEGGGDTGSSGEKRMGKEKGHLKALLVTDAHPDHVLLSDEIMEKLTWRPQQMWRDDADLAADGNNPNVTGGGNDDGDNVLFPGLEYLSFYDVGSTASRKLPMMLRSRTAASPNPTVELRTASTSIAKLKMFETWHQYTGLNDVSYADWEEVERLRDEGLVLRLFQSSDSGSCMTDAERVLLKQYMEEGLVVRDYLHDIGQFAPIPLREVRVGVNSGSTE